MNKMTQSNIERLEKAGFHFVGPEYGKAACGTEGVGRLARIPVIIKLVTLLLEKLERKKNLP